MIILEKLTVPYEKVKWKESVFVSCDYCGVEVLKTKQKIQKGRKFIQKDCCSNDCCTKKKLVEVNIFKYGVVNSFQRNDVKDKIKKTNIERYGVEYAQQSEKIREKSRFSCLKKHSVEHALQNKKLLQKAQKTSLERHGSKFPIQLDKFKEKVRKTNLERYGTEDFLNLADTKERIRKTNIERYGSPFPIKKFGKTQKEITNWLNSYGFNFISDYEILEGKELDCYDKDQKFALEYCGLYWHNENSPEPRMWSYHRDKWKRCKEKGIQLLTIFDDEWKSKKEVCESLILSKLGFFKKRIQARKCSIKNITKKEMCDFCDLYHLQGSNKLSEVCFGLFYQKELVGVIDLGRHHRKKEKASIVLTRLCFKNGLQIIGGSSKLFKACVEYCKNKNINTIVSWSDNRYSTGRIYEKLGFVKKEELKPDYYYVNMKNPKKRISKQSQSKKNSNCPKNMTELEWANHRGFSRIWDCGKIRWEMIFGKKIKN